MFFIPAGLGLITAYLTDKHFPPTLAGKTETASRYLEAFKRPEILKVFVYIFLISLFYHGVRQWLGVYFAQSLGLKQFFVSLLLTVGSLAGIFGEAIGGHLSDKKGRVRTLKAGVFMMTLAVFFMIFMRSAFIIPLLMFLWGFGWTMNHAGLSTFLTDLDKRYIKEVSSLNSSIRFISGGLGVVLGGWIMQQSFSLGFLIYALLLFVMLIFTKRILAVDKI